MPGPAPKFPEKRARANKPVSGEWVSVEPIEDPILPELPDDDGMTWNTRTRRLWKGWQRDPATRLYGESEVAMATELAFMHAKAVRGDDNAPPWSVITGWMDRLGLTPKGKKDLRIRVVRAAEPAPVLTIVPQLDD